MQPDGSHQLQVSKAQHNQEKLYDDGRVRGSVSGWDRLYKLQMLTENVKN